MAQSRQQAVRDELDVLDHLPRVHADQGARERVADELLLHLHSAADDVVNRLIRELVLHQLVDEAREVGVEALVPRDELVGEGQPRHQPTLLQPVDGAEAAAEQDALHGREAHEALVEGPLKTAFLKIRCNSSQETPIEFREI